ncbi:MAG: hypothetical protein IJ206_08150 [Oscillospiraceae bacterium]|nr:hypothetical protein [Oscillospiraceae bacterium]
MKSRFEEMGGTYTEIDGIFYPNLALPEPELRPIVRSSGMRKGTNSTGRKLDHRIGIAKNDNRNYDISKICS